MLTKQDILLESSPGQGKGTEENCSAAWLTVSGFMVMGLVSGLSLANHSDSVLSGGAHLVQPRRMPERRILRGGSDMCCLLASPELFWWWLITFVFLTRTFCHKTTHANGYYGAWPGWAVSVSVLPLTTPP